eukprot:SAG31_NODE_340_length_17466_cov_5.689987_11_plen_62_part_00
MPVRGVGILIRIFFLKKKTIQGLIVSRIIGRNSLLPVYKLLRTPGNYFKIIAQIPTIYHNP